MGGWVEVGCISISMLWMYDHAPLQLLIRPCMKGELGGGSILHTVCFGGVDGKCVCGCEMEERRCGHIHPCLPRSTDPPIRAIPHSCPREPHTCTSSSHNRQKGGSPPGAAFRGGEFFEGTCGHRVLRLLRLFIIRTRWFAAFTAIPIIIVGGRGRERCAGWSKRHLW